MTEQERALRDLLRAWTVLFAAGSVSFATQPGRTLATLNLLPGESVEVGEEHFWNALAVSLMVTLTVLCGVASRDVRRHRPLIAAVLVSKAASTGMFLARFRRRRQPAYLAGAATDGSILLITARRFLAAR